MIFFFQLILFIILVYVIFYAPGRYLLKQAKFSYPQSVTMLLSFGLGITVFLITSYLFAWVKLDFMACILAGSLTLIDRGRSFLELTSQSKNLKNHKFEAILLASGIIGMCYLTWLSGIEKGGEYYFYGVNAVDSLYHLALIGNLTHSFPPEHFGLSGIPLRGYHFFYDFLIALFAKYFHFQIVDLYLRFFPLLLSFLFGLSFLALSYFLKWRKSVTIGVIFVVFFLSNFEYFINYFVHSELLVHIPEGLTQILDPSVPFSIMLFICGYILFSTKNKTFIQIAITALIIGILPMVKVYTAFLFFAGLGLALLWNIYKKNYKKHVVLMGLSAIISAVVYLPVNFGAGNFIFAPFLYWRHLMEGSHVFQNLHFPMQYLIFEQHANFPRMAFILAIIGVIFFILTLGWRIPVGIVYLYTLRRKRISIKEGHIFWSGVFLTGLLIPILFIQSSSVFNIVQFYWIILSLSLPFFVMQLHEVTSKYSKRTIGIIWSVIILSCLPSHLVLFKEYSAHPTIISKDVVTLTKSISARVPLDQSLLILSKKDSYQVPLFSSLTSRSVYLETEGIDFSSLQNVIYDRQQIIDRISIMAERCNESTKEKDTEVLKKLILSTNSHYVVTPSTFPCLQNNSSFRILSNNSGQQLVQILR